MGLLDRKSVVIPFERALYLPSRVSLRAEKSVDLLIRAAISCHQPDDSVLAISKIIG